VHVIEDRDSSEADEQSVDTTKSSATRSRAATVRSVTSVILIYKTNLSPVHTVAEKCDCRRKRRDNGVDSGFTFKQSTKHTD